LKNVLILFLLAVLSACSSQPPVPENHFYQLSAPQVKKNPLTATKSILVHRPSASGIYNERSMLYVEQRKPLAIKRYHYHLWVRPPAILVRDYLVAYLRDSGTFTKVLTRKTTAGSIAELNIYIQHFEHILDGARTRVVIEFGVTIVQQEKQLIKTFRVEQLAGDQSVHAAARAFSQALDKVAGRILKDMN